MPIAVLNLDNRGQATGTLFWHATHHNHARDWKCRACGNVVARYCCRAVGAVVNDPINSVGLGISSPRTFGPIRRTSVGYSETLKRFLIKKCATNRVMYDPSACRAILQWHCCSSGVTTKRRACSRPCLNLDTKLSVGSIARVRTNIQATTTAQVNATASD